MGTSCRRSASPRPCARRASRPRRCVSTGCGCATATGDAADMASRASSEGTLSYLWGLIDFRGPALLADLKSRTYATYSFFDVLQSQEQIDAKMTPVVDPAVFRGKIVFVGTTAAGLFDVFETPFSHGKMPGINIHAAVADDILSNRFLTNPPPSRPRRVGRRGCACWSAPSSAAIPAWWATAFALAFLALLGWLATDLFANGHWVNLSQPVLASCVRAVRRRRLPVLRRGTREAEDEEAVRPVRLEGRLRAARGEPGARAPRRPAARDDGALL